MLIIGVFVMVSALSQGVDGKGVQALKENQTLRDQRLKSPRTLNSTFPFKPVDSPQAWEKRAEEIRLRVRVATGLWPEPTKTPLKAVIHGKVDRPEYTVEKVYFQSYPGHFVTGNLYRPKGSSGKLPAVLSPHGHTGTESTRQDNGRFHDHGSNTIRYEIASGAERFPVGGRHPLQARAVQLARMGCIVFQYDMVGYSDSLQLPHKGLGVRQEMNTSSRWGFSSPQAELHLQSLMGLQTWNSVRAMDFLTSLPDVDTQRIAVEGHSGGGTQVFILGAIDERPSVLFPAVMVSTAMQGGCLCENASYLRIDTGNVDIAALAAPRPLGMTGANDWTIETEVKGFPDLQHLYGMLAKEELVHIETFPQFGHNYNSVSRTVMYNWLNRHLELGFDEPIIERDFLPLSREEASVWTGDHADPQGRIEGQEHERSLLEWMTEDSEQKIAPPNSKDQLERFLQVTQPAFNVILGRRIGDNRSAQFNHSGEEAKDDYQLELGTVRNEEYNEELPVAILKPDHRSDSQEVVIWVHADGKAGLFDSSGQPRPEIRQLLAGDLTVVGVDLLFQGESLDSRHHGELLDIDIGINRARMESRGDGSQPWHLSPVYTFGYNYPLFSQRVHDILSVIHYLHQRQDYSKIHLAGLGRVAGPLAAAAAAQSYEVLEKVAIDTGEFRFGQLTRFDHPMFLPGAVKYGDLAGLLVLRAGYDLWLADDSQASLEIVKEAYLALEAEQKLTLHDQNGSATDAAVRWLVN